MNGTNNLSARESFELSKETFFQAFLNSFNGDAMKTRQFVNSLKLSQSEIRLEVGLDVNNSSFSFGLLPTQANSQGVNYLTEQRLNQQDSLVMYEYGIYVCRGLAADGVTADTNATEFELLSYGNTQVFSAGAATAINGGFFNNGAFRITCNNDIISPYRSLRNHFYRGQTQQTGPLGQDSPGDQIRGVEDGIITSEPNLILIGSKNYELTIKLKKALSAVDAGTRAVFFAKGILAQNSTVVS